MKPLAIDLFTGLGGWAEGFKAEGYRVIGFDIDPRFAKDSPCDEFVLADVRNLDGRRFKDARVIVASPPCNEFSKINDMAHRRTKAPDTALVEAVWRIRQESGVNTILENVDRAQAFWGDVPMLPWMRFKPKIGGSWNKSRPSYKDRVWAEKERLQRTGWAGRSRSKMGAALRAKIPFPLARAVARGFL